MLDKLAITTDKNEEDGFYSIYHSLGEITREELDYLFKTLDENNHPKGICYLDNPTDALPSTEGLEYLNNLYKKGWKIRLNNFKI